MQNTAEPEKKYVKQLWWAAYLIFFLHFSLHFLFLETFSELCSSREEITAANNTLVCVGNRKNQVKVCFKVSAPLTNGYFLLRMCKTWKRCVVQVYNITVKVIVAGATGS